ncbi:hypothetical protein LQV05_006469 [Cryptococcus neoformans]|nr:spermine transporter [Cryptococcus neoformans var. grubii]OXC62577.1 spermine transporter [Cryptococcus neoformans var. grubii MW-RSA852]UOH83732.1 hypothetical protein LQV05_006469 [Cryptococcus neoformans]
MIIPAEAEVASPPIFTENEETVLEEEDVEQPDLHRIATHLHDPTSTATLSDDQAQITVGQTVFSHDLEKGEGRMVVDFAEGQYENPKEWSKGKKWFVTIATSILCLTVALGSAMPTGDLPGAAETLHVSNEAIYLTIALFVVGFGVGPLLFAPLSEVIGRKTVYCISIFFYFIFTLPSCLAPNIATMLAGRMIAGIAASAPMTNVGGTIADIWSVEERGIPMALFSGMIFMGPCLGPLFGGWIAYKTGQWRWIYWVLFIFVGVVFLFTLIMPETLAPILLRRKAKKLNKDNHTDSYVSKHDLHHIPLSTTLKTAMIRPFILMFMEPIILFMSFYLSFVYSLLYATFFAFPIAFEEIRGWNMGITGVSFVSIIIGIAAALLCMPLQERIYKKACQNGQVPEARLYPMLLGCLILPIALFILAFTSYPGIHWIGPCVAGVLFGFSMVIIYISANSYIVDSYASFAASAIAAKTLMRSLIGASVPLWITQLFHNLGFQYAGLFLALISCAIVPIPWIFFFKGAAVRKRSKRAEKSGTN